MGKFDQALTGFNTNFRHKGKVYHLQTEDSGEGHPHIITHVFVDGHIVATRKTSYEEWLASSDLKERVRELMKEQHRAMAFAIRDGMLEDDRGRAREVTGSERRDEDRKKRLRSISGVYRQVHRREGRPPPPPGAGRMARAQSRPVPIPRFPDDRPGGEGGGVEGSGQGRQFGEDLLTDKTLEEVIASYLSDEPGKG
jgi:hypothetical protein